MCHYRLLYDYLEKRKIGYKTCGKLLIACNQIEECKLEQLYHKAQLNGVDGLVKLSVSDVKHMEPEITCTKGLYSPETGILDSHNYQDSLKSDAESNGANYVYNCEVQNVVYHPSNSKHSFQIDTNQGIIDADYVINAAGLNSIFIAHRIKQYRANDSSASNNNEQTTTSHIPSSYYAKGNYFKLNSVKSPFRHLVYPVPSSSHGLGVHATLDMNDQVKFGPDVEWLKPHTTDINNIKKQDFKNNVDEYLFPDDYDVTKQESSSVYKVNDTKKDEFVKSIQNYWPGIINYELIPDYSGIRPKLQSPFHTSDTNLSNRDLNDFQIDDWKVHHMKGLINLYGIESPGLTASLSIAKHVADLLETLK